MNTVSILILLDYLFLFLKEKRKDIRTIQSQSLFYWITYSYDANIEDSRYGYIVSILILLDYLFLLDQQRYTSGSSICRSQSLFYWITYSYRFNNCKKREMANVSILILLDYLFLSVLSRKPSIYYCYRIFFRH